MAYLLKPDLFKSMTSAVDVARVMKQDIKNAAGKDVEFVAARDVPIGAAKVSLFVVTDAPKAWESVLKQKKSAAVAIGTCRVVKGAKIQVAVKAVTTGSKVEALTIAKKAINEYAPIDFAEYLARQSRTQAGQGGGSAHSFEITDAVFAQMLKVSGELSEYNTFARAFEKLATEYKMTNYKQIPVNIWADLLKALVKSGYVNEKIPKTADGRAFILAYQGPAGKVVREALLATAMKAMGQFTKHADTYLDKVIKQVLSAGGTPTWAFWSGAGAKEAAKKETTGGVVLEGSVGSWFDDVYNFKPFTGVENMALWTSLSELYAQKAAQYYDSFNFRGFVGQDATRDQSVFNKIEQPTFIDILTVHKTVKAPQVEWFVVDCVKDGDRWKGTGAPSVQFDSRESALAEITKRYGG